MSLGEHPDELISRELFDISHIAYKIMQPTLLPGSEYRPTEVFKLGLRQGINPSHLPYCSGDSSLLASTQPPKASSKPRELSLQMSFALFSPPASPETQELLNAPTSPCLNLGRKLVIPIYSLAFGRDKIRLLLI